MNRRRLVATLAMIFSSSFFAARSAADDRSIYNRTGSKIRLTVQSKTSGAEPLRSPLLDNDEKWSVDLASERYDVKIEHPDGAVHNAGVISFADPRKNVANLVKRQVSKTTPRRDPDTGEISNVVTVTTIYSFIYGSEEVDQKGLRFGITFVAADRGVQMTEIHPDMPSTRCQIPDGQILTLEPGDTIVTVNGTEIEGLDGMLKAIASSPRSMRFQVIDARTGQLLDMTTELAW